MEGDVHIEEDALSVDAYILPPFGALVIHSDCCMFPLICRFDSITRFQYI